MDYGSWHIFTGKPKHHQHPGFVASTAPLPAPRPPHTPALLGGEYCPPPAPPPALPAADHCTHTCGEEESCFQGGVQEAEEQVGETAEDGICYLGVRTRLYDVYNAGTTGCRLGTGMGGMERGEHRPKQQNTTDLLPGIGH